MKATWMRVLCLLTLLAAFLWVTFPSSPAQAADMPAVTGSVLDPQGEPVRGARVELYLNGNPEPDVQAESGENGLYLIDLPDVSVNRARVVVDHPHFEPSTWRADQEHLMQLRAGAAVRVPDIALERRLTPGFWIASTVFAAVLGLIVTERLHSTTAALLGIAAALGISLIGGAIGEELFIIGFEHAIAYIDFDVIFLVLGMMIIVGIIEQTGIFQWTAYHAYRMSRGKIWLLAVILMLLTSVASALLDNVTTMLLMAPITLQIALALGINPLSLLIPEMLASNVGGISTLIGTPNNILIGSYAGLSFNDFLRNLTPGVLMAQVALSVYVVLVFRKQHQAVDETDSRKLLERLKENAQITRPDILRKAGLVFLAILFFFVLGERIHLVPAVTAMIGAAVILVVVQADVQEILRVVDWATLLFFMALFMLVGALQEVGLISLIASGVHSLVAGDLPAATLATIWITALLCLLIPTIPLTAALLPVVGFLSRNLPDAGNNVLFYSLALGSALGANNSLIGAANNMVAAGIAERSGYRITYSTFIKFGFPAALVTLLVGTLWILVRF